MMALAGNALVSLLERELEKHSPEIQQFILNELSVLIRSLMSHLESKLQSGANHG